MASNIELEEFLEGLERVKPTGTSKWTACCPAHDDRHPSLSIAEGDDGQLLAYCHAGCTFEEILDAWGMLKKPTVGGPGEWTPFGPAVEVYDYTDLFGTLLFQVCRTKDKQFPQRRPDPSSKSGYSWNLDGVTRMLYRYDRVRKAARTRQTIYVVEGEKDVHAIEAEGAVATCSPGGAGKWKPEFAQALGGANVIVVADRDEPGYRHAATVAASLKGHAGSIRTVEARRGKDVSDHLAAGYPLSDLLDVTFDRSAVIEVADRSDGIVLTRASEARPQPIVWLWEGYIAVGTVNVLSGEPGINKSTMAFGIAAGLSVGKSGDPANSLILSTEDSFHNTIVPRLMAADADLARIAHLQKCRDGITSHLQFPEDSGDLREAICDFEARLVIIDPLMGHLKGSIDSHKEQDIRRVMSDLCRIAEETNCAILSINHLNKNTSSNALYRIAGSFGVAAAARSVLQMVRNPNDPDQRILTSTKLNVGKEPPGLIYQLNPVTIETESGPIESMRLVRCGITTLTSDELLRPERKSQEEKAEELLYELLPENGNPVDTAIIKQRAEEQGLAWRVVQKARTNIGRITTKRSGDTTMWAMDPQT